MPVPHGQVSEPCAVLSAATRFLRTDVCSAPVLDSLVIVWEAGGGRGSAADLVIDVRVQHGVRAALTMRRSCGG
jgi:hypothetical protein